MRTTFLKKLLNSTLAFSIATSGIIIPNPKAYAQAMQTEAEQQNDELLSVDFSNYPTLAEGWEAKADKKPYSGGVTSSKSLKLNKSGYYLQTPSFNLESDATLTFYTKGYSTEVNVESVLKVQVLENGAWTDIHTLTIFDTANFIKTEVKVPQTATKVKIVLETKGAFNVALDGVALTGTGSIVEGGTEETPETPDHEEVKPPTNGGTTTPDNTEKPGNGETTTPPTDSKPDADAYGELVISGASSLEVGMNSTLQVTTKNGESISDATFTSSDQAALSVDNSGKIKALKEGTHVVSAAAMIDGKKYIGDKRIVVSPATEYPVTVFTETFSKIPEFAEGWETNLTADDNYGKSAVKFTKQGQYITTEEFRLDGHGLLKFVAKGNASQANGTTVLRVQYQSNFKDEWKNLAMFNSFANNNENFGVRIPEDATRIRIIIEEKGKMNISFDDMSLVAQGLGVKEPDTEKPVIQLTDSVTEGNLDFDITIKADVTDNRKVGDVTLYYRVVGENEFKSVPMGLNDGVYQGIIGKKDLDAKGIEYKIEASDIEGNKATTDINKISISSDDKTNPEITSISPADNANVGKNKTPKISAKYADRSGIKLDSIKLFFNDEEVTEKATITETELTYQVKEALENGTYKVKLQLADNAGNETEKEWTFKVSDVARNLYFGQLHSHTNLSDGAGSIDDAYTHAREKAKVDFLAVTDHSNSFDNDTQANIADGSMSTKWQTGLNAADKYNEDHKFTAIYAYEMTWSAGTGKYGHMNTFNTEGFETRTNSAMNLRNYYETLKTQPQSISQFNHPGTTFGDFVDFGFYDEEIDQLITLVEVGNGDGPIRSSAHFPSYEYYTRALDKGWHVAPTNNQDNHKGLWGNANTARTVIEAEELTRDSLYEAIRERRVYSTEDENLHISYELNGATMGSILSEQDSAEVYIKVMDPDAGDTIDKIQLITDGGRVAHEITNVDATEKEWTLSFEPEASSTYYYVKVTQNDLDIAVTAPVWIGEKENVGISGVTVSSSKVLVGDEVTVDAVVYNNEATPVTNAKVEYFVNGSSKPIATAVLATIKPSDTATLSASFPLTKKGKNVIEAVITLTVNGAERQYSERIEVKTFDSSEVSHVLIDGSHANAYVTESKYPNKMQYVTELVGQEGGIVHINEKEITADVLNGMDVLILTDPSNDHFYSDSEVEAIKAYVEAGGHLIITSKADYGDKTGEYGNAAQGNKVLEAIGSALRFNDDQVIDNTEYSNQKFRLYFDDYNEESPYTKGIDFGKIEQGNSSNQDYKFSFYSGNSVLVEDESANVDVVVKGHPTTQNTDADNQDDWTEVKPGEVVALAVETLDNGAKIIASGVTFFSDFEMDPTRDYSNRTIMTNIINDVAPAKAAQITPIAELHVDANGDNEPDLKGETRTIEGIITSGNNNPLTSFFDVVYVQDETGGITIHPIANTKLKLGQKVRITGVVGSYEGDTQLGEVQELTDVEIIDESINLVDPTKLSTADSMLEKYEGLLVSAQGVVKSIDTQAGNIIINDGSGDARVHINGYIGGGQSGEEVGAWANRIKVGDTLSVIGLAAEDAAGKRIRVRNTDEVIVVEASTETPDNGGTTTPDNGGATTPGNGGATTPGNGGATTPGNGGTTTPGNGENETSEYNIPQSLKDSIDTTVITPVYGKGTQSSPLKLEVSVKATVESIQKLMSGYKVTVKITPTRSVGVTYDITLTNEVETHYLQLTVPTQNEAVINFLNSLVEPTPLPAPKPDNGGNGNNNGSNQSSETPETGYGQLFGWFAAGMAFIIAGYVAYTTNKRKNESK